MHAGAQERVQHELETLVREGSEQGLQVAAYLDGELVVDAWAGSADPDSRRSVDGNTLFASFSVTKAFVSSAVHRLVEQGTFHYDSAIADFWPEFGAHGKESVTLRDVLAHRAGIPQLPDRTTPELMCDWQEMCGRIAMLMPLWTPGTATGYHSYTWGWITGEFVRRATGRSIARVVQEEVCQPLAITSFLLGLADDAEDRVAHLEDGGWVAELERRRPDSLYRRVLPTELGLPEVFNRPEVRKATLPAAGGIMNARAVARLFAGLVGPVNGNQLLSENRLLEATELQTSEKDLVLERPVPKALGYFLGGPLSPMGNRKGVFGHPGIGGAIGFADPELRFAFGLCKNSMTVSPPGEGAANRIARVVREGLQIPDGLPHA